MTCLTTEPRAESLRTSVLNTPYSKIRLGSFLVLKDGLSSGWLKLSQIQFPSLAKTEPGTMAKKNSSGASHMKKTLAFLKKAPESMEALLHCTENVATRGGLLETNTKWTLRAEPEDACVHNKRGWRFD